MRIVRTLAALLALGIVAGPAAAQVKETPKPKPAPGRERRVRRVFGAPFRGLKGLSDTQREKLAALWTETKKGIAAANTQQLNALKLKVYHENGEKVLNDAQRKELGNMRAERETRIKAARERKPTTERPKARPILRAIRGPLADLKDLTDDQIKKINELSATRAAASKAARYEMREKVEAADKAFQKQLDQVLTGRQKAVIKATVEKAKAQQEAAAKRAAEERAKRNFGGDFRRLSGFNDEQRLALGQLWREFWRESQAASAAARKAEAAARAAYVTKGKKLLTAEQLKALEEIIKKSTARPRRTRRAA